MGLILGLIAGLSANVASATTLGLFVGVNQYANTVENDLTGKADPGFHDLQAPVADLVLAKRDLSKFTGATFDPGPSPQSADCRSASATSTTLIDACATRANILSELQQLIDKSASGDRIVFYYAGLTSLYVPRPNPQGGDPAAGEGLPLLTPADAKRAAGVSSTDIPQTQLDLYFHAANRRGVSVVMITDPCEPSTLGGDEYRPRTAPPYSGPLQPLVPSSRNPAIAPDAAYSVRVTADCPGSAFFELVLHGGLARDLDSDLAGSRRALFRDAPASVKTYPASLTRQGGLIVKLPLSPAAIVSFPPPIVGDPALLTLGSIFAVYPGAATQTAPKRAIGRAMLVDISGDQALLQPDAPLRRARLAGGSLYVREIAHDFGEARFLRLAAASGVVGGQPVKPGDAPWMVEIEHVPAPGFRFVDDTPMTRHDCGGTLIAETWVITAAHCVGVDKLGRPDVTSAPTLLAARAGSTNLLSGMVTLPIDHAFVHPRYCNSDHEPRQCDLTSNDIALFHLASPAPNAFGDRGPQLKLPDVLYTLKPGAPLTLMGWGARDQSDAKAQIMAPDLQFATLNLTDRETCRKDNAPLHPDRFSHPIPLGIVCARADTGLGNACKGDSGGPLIVGRWTAFSTPTVVGVVSSSFECDRVDSLYTQVSRYRGWINTVLGSIEDNPTPVTPQGMGHGP